MRAFAVMALSVTALGAATTVTRTGRADDAESEASDVDPSHWLEQLEVEAGSAEADLRLRELELREGVKVRLSPYYLRADRIHLSLGKYGVRVKGHGVLGFCPCDAPPISIGFSGGWAGPPDELIVEDPTLRIFGVPVFWLPYLWLRTPRKIGLGVPEVSFRGRDGLFLGEGVHLPIGGGLEASVGVYTGGGFAGTVDFVTERSLTLLRVDERRGSDVGEHDVPSGWGLAVDAHGEVGRVDRVSMAWDLDAIRGARGLRTTLDLEPLARPWDHAFAVTRAGPALLGVDLIDARGGPLDSIAVAHPWSGLAGAFGLGTLGGADAWATFGPRWIVGRGAETIADASASIALAGPLGVATWSADARVDARLARAAGEEGSMLAGGHATAIVGEARVEASLPLARALSLERAAGGPPVLHVIEPLVRAAAVVAGDAGDRRALEGFVGAPALDAKRAGLAVAGMRTSLGALGGGIAPGTDPWIGKLTGEAVIGLLAIDDRGSAEGGSRLDGRRDLSGAGRLSWETRQADGGSTLIVLEGAGARSVDAEWGWLGVGRARWESSRDGFGVELRSALRSELPVLAGWALLGADVAPRLTTATGLVAPGATIGLGTGFPVGLGFRLAGDVDVFGASLGELFTAGGTQLLETRATIRYRHPCGCFRMAVRGGHVVGREGVDVFASFELAPDAPQGRDF